MRNLLAIAFVSLLALGCGDTPSSVAPPEPESFPSEIDPAATKDQMSIFARSRRGDRERLFRFAFSLLPARDLEPRPEDGVYGTNWWRPGDRHRYDTAWVFLTHEDPGHHPELQGFRIVIQAYGDHPIQINDKGLKELHPQGLPPYPYEPDAGVVPIDRSRPAGENGAGVIEFMHQRGLEKRGKKRQLLQRYVIPEFGEVWDRKTRSIVSNEKVRWYYQLGGLWVAEHEDYGIIARVIVTSMHDRYGFGVTSIRNPVTGRPRSLASAADYIDVVGFDSSR